MIDWLIGSAIAAWVIAVVRRKRNDLRAGRLCGCCSNRVSCGGSCCAGNCAGGEKKYRKFMRKCSDDREAGRNTRESAA